MKTVVIVMHDGFLLGAFSIYEEAKAFMERHKENTEHARRLLGVERNQYSITTLVVDEWVK